MWDIRQTDIKLTSDNNIFKTRALFRDYGSEYGPYTMSGKNRVINDVEYISAYQVFMDSVNEYEAAMRIVGDMNHWRKLIESDWFMNGDPSNGIYSGLKHWREDHAMKRESESLRQLTAAAESGNVQAAKYLNEMTGKKLSSRKKDKAPKTENKQDKLILERLRRVK